MVPQRRKPTPNDWIHLVSEVDGCCPLCGEPLLYEKNGSQYKAAEIAHIYPLNPSREEETLLSTEERLHDDVNNVANLIALSPGCHKKYDKPRTVEEYRRLVLLKRRAVGRVKEREAWSAHPLREEVRAVVSGLVTSRVADVNLAASALNYDPQSLDRKADETLTVLTRELIRQYIVQHYGFVAKSFKGLGAGSPVPFEVISHQVRVYYLSLVEKGASQEEAFLAVSRWIEQHTEGHAIACQIVTAFFVQKCEVFGDSAGQADTIR